MVDRTAKLEAALRVNAALRVQAERLIAAYVAPESDRGAIINELIALFDGPAQREADRLRQRRWARLLTASTTTRRAARRRDDGRTARDGGLASGREGKRKALGLEANPSDKPTLAEAGIDKHREPNPAFA
jgi:hypothetical protein